MLNLQAPLNLNCFHQSYETARSAFQNQLKQVDQSLIIKLFEYQHPLLSPTDSDLFCDVVFLGQSKQPKKVLVLISATHGIEGFTGSAVQIDVLPQLSNLLLKQPEIGIVLVHALNPWGFAWLRRCDHTGVDLNRNFIDFTQALPENHDYDTLKSRLYNQSETENPLCCEPWRELWCETGLEAFVNKVSQGQYQDPQGIYYGGTEPTWSRLVIEQVASEPFILNAQQLSVIDIHTGLGPYGYGELINDHLPDTAGFDWVNRVYGANACSALLGESCSAPKQGLLDCFWHDLIKDKSSFVTLEYGTYSVEGLIGNLLAEQAYQNRLKQGEIRSLTANEVLNLRAFFYPDESSWKQQVLFRARQIIGLALKGMTR